MDAVDTELEVQVRTGGPACRAHGANRLALFHGLPLLDVNAAQVGVDGDMAAVAVLDEHHIAKTVLPARKLNHAVAHSTYLGAGGGGKVRAQVLAPGVVDGVHAHGKAAADARELYGGAQVGAAQAGAVHGVVGATLAGLLEPHGLVQLVAVVEFCGQHAARAQEFAVGFQGFVDDGEAVTFVQAVEIDLFKDVGDLHGHGIGQARGIGRGEQAAVDGATRQAGAGGQRCAGHGGAELAVGIALQHQALEVLAGFVLDPAHGQLAQLVVVAGFGGDQAAIAAEQVLAGQLVAAQEGGGARIGNAQALQQGLGGVAGAGVVGAIEREIVEVRQVRQRTAFHQRGDGLRECANRQFSGIWTQRGHSKRAAACAEHEGGDGCGESLGVSLNGPGQLCKQSTAGRN